jgi:flagellar basal body-associated protein FliL
VRSPRVSSSGQHSSGGGGAAPEADVESPAASKAKRSSGLSTGGAAADTGLAAAAVKESDSPRAKQRKRRRLCCILTLLLALVAAGIGVGVWQGIEKSRPQSAVQQQQQQPGAPLTFRVTVGALTAEQSAVACAKWFGDKQVSSKLPCKRHKVEISHAMQLPAMAATLQTFHCNNNWSCTHWRQPLLCTATNTS